MASLLLDSVSRAFGGVHAVENLSIQVPGGTITGLIGPNGAGKSTVVNLITGLLKVDSGRIMAADADITELEPHLVARHGVARTFQNIRLFASSTVLDNLLVGFHRHERLGLAANLFGLPAVGRELRELKKRAHALLERFDMLRFADLPAGDLSYGHQRRVEMMRALASDPRFLLLDEPIAGMNDVEAGQLGRIYRDIAATGVGILLIEHNVGFVASHCETVHVLNTGRLIASGSPATVFSNPEVIEAYVGA